MPHSHDEVRARASILARYPLLTGTAIGVASLLPHLVLGHSLSVSFAAMLIAFIAGAYFGFAVVNGSPREQLVEFSVAVLFLLAGVLGVAYWPGIIALAYLCHAAWDFAHHNRAHLSLVRIPSWYVPWCAIIDIIIGLGLIVVWRLNGVL